MCGIEKIPEKVKGFHATLPWMGGRVCVCVMVGGGGGGGCRGITHTCISGMSYLEAVNGQIKARCNLHILHLVKYETSH